MRPLSTYPSAERLASLPFRPDWGRAVSLLDLSAVTPARPPLSELGVLDPVVWQFTADEHARLGAHEPARWQPMVMLQVLAGLHGLFVHGAFGTPGKSDGSQPRAIYPSSFRHAMGLPERSPSSAPGDVPSMEVVIRVEAAIAALSIHWSGVAVPEPPTSPTSLVRRYAGLNRKAHAFRTTPADQVVRTDPHRIPRWVQVGAVAAATSVWPSGWPTLGLAVAASAFDFQAIVDHVGVADEESSYTGGPQALVRDLLLGAVWSMPLALLEGSDVTAASRIGWPGVPVATPPGVEGLAALAAEVCSPPGEPAGWREPRVLTVEDLPPTDTDPALLAELVALHDELLADRPLGLRGGVLVDD